MSRRSKLNLTANTDPSEVQSNVTSFKIPGRSNDEALDTQTEEHRRPKEANVDEMSEAPGGSAACCHSRAAAVDCELPSFENANCECEAVMTRSRKRRISSEQIADWELVHTIPQLGSDSSSHQSADLGIVLPNRFLRFCTDSGNLQVNVDSSAVLPVGLIKSGRIIHASIRSLRKATTRAQSDDGAFAQMISQACADCHAQCDASEEMLARDFVSKVEVCGALSCPTFESIFDRICLICYNIQLEESDRARFLHALHCVCSFKGFQARFLTGRGLLALISLLFACQSCLCADLALNCVISISATQNAAMLVIPEMIEALLSLVDTHVSAAAKVAIIFEKW